MNPAWCLMTWLKRDLALMGMSGQPSLPVLWWMLIPKVPINALAWKSLDYLLDPQVTQPVPTNKEAVWGLPGLSWPAISGDPCGSLWGRWFGTNLQEEKGWVSKNLLQGLKAEGWVAGFYWSTRALVFSTECWETSLPNRSSGWPN